MTLKEKKNLPEKVFNEMFSTITGEHPTKWIENYTKEEPKEKRYGVEHYQRKMIGGITDENL